MDNLAVKDFSDALPDEYAKNVPTLWSDLYMGRVQVVPEDIKEFAANKCKAYATNGYGYEGKDYSNLQKSVQIDANANSDEATIRNLINNDTDFVERVNARIAELARAGDIYAPTAEQPLLLSGHYKFNDYHGMTNHDLPQPMHYEEGKTHADLLSAGFHRGPIAWRVEVKTDVVNKQPTGVHKADIVFLHILGTNTIMMYLPTAPNETRSDATYICAGNTSPNTEWHNIKVNKDWSIKPW
jgi:hypothetical protein